MKDFFLCYGDETPGSVEPFGEHDSCFEGGSSKWFAQGSVISWAGVRRTLSLCQYCCPHKLLCETSSPNRIRKRISQRAPDDYERFLFVLWRWNSRKRGALWRTRFLLLGRFIGMSSTRKLAIIAGSSLSTYFLTRPLLSGKFILFIWKYWLFPQTRYNNSRFVYYY